VNPEVANAAWRDLYWYGLWPDMPGVPENQEIRKKYGTLQQQLNVTITALHFAYRAGYRRVAFVGCDFAFTGGFNHWSEPAIAEPYWEYSFAEQIGGGLVLTETMWAIEARCHEAAAYFMNRAGVEVVNCTGNGIMTGMPCAKLDEVLEK
jgi:hypothetical protein